MRVGCRGYVARVAEDMLQGLPRICCMGCRGYVDRGKTKSTPSPSFGLELGLEFDKNLSKLTKYYFPGVSPQNVKRPPVWKLPSMTQQRLPGGPVEQLREK